MPHHVRGWRVAASLMTGLSLPACAGWGSAGLGLAFGAGLTTGGRRYIGRRCRSFAAVTAAMAAQVVAMMDVPTMAVGLMALLAARTAIAVAGMSWIELVLIARYVHIALVAVPGRGLSVSRSFMARNRAAWRRAQAKDAGAIFISIEPIAGWSAGTSGNSQTISGRKGARQQSHQARPFGQPHDAEP